MLGQLNFSRKIIYHFAYLLLVGIISSQTRGKEPKHLDPFLEVLVDEILSLSSCKIYDAYRKATLHVKVNIMIYILDYQGLGKLFRLTGTGSYRGCGWCLQKGQYCKHLHKVVYPENRDFLPANHKLRKDHQNFLDHVEETREKPTYCTFSQDVSFHKAYGNEKNTVHSSRIAAGTGCREMYVLAVKSPSFNRIEQTVPDAMHTIAVQVKHLLRCLGEKAPEDSLAVRLHENSLDRFWESWPNVSASSSSSSKDNSGGKKTKKKKSEREVVSSLPIWTNQKTNGTS